MVLEKNTKYTGELIHNRFAYDFLRERVSPLGDVVIFRGGMEVTTNLIDKEDLISRDYIFSEDAVNIIWEIPNLCPLGAVAFQRLFNMQIANNLSLLFLNKPIEVRGDDMIVHSNFIGSDGSEQKQGKASVSITYSKNNVALGHTGININAGKFAPNFAYSTNLTDEQVAAFMDGVNTSFYNILHDMFVATTKVIA